MSKFEYVSLPGLIKFGANLSPWLIPFRLILKAGFATERFISSKYRFGLKVVGLPCNFIQVANQRLTNLFLTILFYFESLPDISDSVETLFLIENCKNSIFPIHCYTIVTIISDFHFRLIIFRLFLLVLISRILLPEVMFLSLKYCYLKVFNIWLRQLKTHHLLILFKSICLLIMNLDMVLILVQNHQDLTLLLNYYPKSKLFLQNQDTHNVSNKR